MATAHPLVESITYWGLGDRDSWLGAPAGLLRADGSRKPSYHALESLIHGEWWVPSTPLTAVAPGAFRVTGWGGDYRIEGPAGETATVHVAAGASGNADVTRIGAQLAPANAAA